MFCRAFLILQASLPSLTLPAGLLLSSSFSFGWDGLTHLSDGENQEELQFEQVLHLSGSGGDGLISLPVFTDTKTSPTAPGGMMGGLTAPDGAVWQETSSTTCQPLPRMIQDSVFALGRTTHLWRNHGEGAALPPTGRRHSCPLFSASC